MLFSFTFLWLVRLSICLGLQSIQFLHLWIANTSPFLINLWGFLYTLNEIIFFNQKCILFICDLCFNFDYFLVMKKLQMIMELGLAVISFMIRTYLFLFEKFHLRVTIYLARFRLQEFYLGIYVRYIKCSHLWVSLGEFIPGPPADIKIRGCSSFLYRMV